MRLIDADAILKRLEEWDRSDSIDKAFYNFCLNRIIEQPTAYDVEKVVEELACNSRFIDDINEHNIKCISCIIGQKTAIEIVKRGGVK